MVRDLSHDELAELLGAFALDATDQDEADLIEAHLPQCPKCRIEVAEHREAAAFLAHAGAPAPAGLWDRIAESLEAAPPPLDMATVVPMGQRRDGRDRRLPMRLASAGAAVAAAVVAVLGVQVVRQEHRIDQLNIAVGHQSLDQAFTTASVDPAAQHVSLKADNGRVLLAAVLLPSGDGYVKSVELPRLDAAQTYQLWGLVGDQKISLGLLGADPSVQQFRAPHQVRLLAVTAERAGGVVTSAKQPVVQGFLPKV